MLVVVVVVVVSASSWRERERVLSSRAKRLATWEGRRISEAYVFQLMNSLGGATARIHVADFLNGVRVGREGVVVKDRLVR